MSKHFYKVLFMVKEEEGGPKCNGNIISWNGSVLGWKKPCKEIKNREGWKNIVMKSTAPYGIHMLWDR